MSRSSNRFLLLLVSSGLASLVLAVTPAAAQAPSRLDLEVGPGYSIGTGLEDPAPDLGTMSLGATMWLSRTWGVALVRVASYGDDLYDEPFDSGSAITRGTTELRYVRLTARHRRTVGEKWGLVLGAGIVARASFRDVSDLRSASGLVRFEGPEIRWGGLSAEIYVDRSLLRHLSLRAGLSLDTGTETTVFLPAVVAVVRF